MRRMSVAMTKDAVIARRKTVTRRAGWLFAKPGDQLLLVSKTMGLKKGETAEVYATVEVVSVRREPLRAMLDDLDYGFAETTAEGYPDGTREHFPSSFIERFFTSQRIALDDVVTRIEWRYLDDGR